MRSNTRPLTAAASAQEALIGLQLSASLFPLPLWRDAGYSTPNSGAASRLSGGEPHRRHAEVQRRAQQAKTDAEKQGAPYQPKFFTAHEYATVGVIVDLIVPKDEMIRLLREEPGFSDRFIEYMLYRNIRIEEDLVDQLFNSGEKRLARTLLLLARYGKEDKPQGVLPKLSQEMLAEMIGTTRSRVNFFMNKFRKLGFIEYNGGLKINTSLLSIVLHE